MNTPPEHAIMNKTLTSAIFTPERVERNLVAFVGANGDALTYAQSSSLVDRLTEALHELDVGGTDRVAFLVPRGPVGAIGFLAISSIAMCCPLNPRMRSDELARTVETMGITAFVTVDSGSGEELKQTQGLPTLVLTLGQNFGAVSISTMAPSSNKRPEVVPPFALLMQTSGTTSLPKRVELSHENILAAASAIRDAFTLNESDCCLNPMPLHHVHGLISASLSSLVSGSRVICTDGFSTKSFECLIDTMKPTWFTGSPAMHLALLEHFKSQSTRPAQGSLRFFRSSSAPLPASAIDELEQLFGAPLIETYGLTETASMICSNPLPPAKRKLGSVGFAFGSEIRITDDQGKSLPAHENGEIVVRGPSVIRQYGGGGGSEAFFGDWLRTGDVGYLDEDGYLFIVGRTKELIKRGGLSVYPAEVDNVLMSHPAVAEAVTFSVAHPTLGEELVAAIVPRAGTLPTGLSLRTYLEEQLSGYKVPTAILVIEEIPKNETGKIVRRGMAESLSIHLAPKGVPSETAAEAAVLDAWKVVLGREDFGVTDNVFLLGGDPLRGERVAQQLMTISSAAISVKTLLSTPTVREQAALIARQAGAA
jgi:acyl-CoA synthetase (AMP-forming)/AMP-acid ligase II